MMTDMIDDSRRPMIRVNQTQHRLNITLALVVKAPRSGYVKTRLHAHYLPRQACSIYRQFLDRARLLAETWRGRHPDIKLLLAYDPPDQRQFWDHWLQWDKQPQSAGNLGDRLRSVINALSMKSDDAVIFIGADAPELTGQHLDWAVSNLASHDAVMIPATDGGYVLIGLRPQAGALLENITWGTEKVAAETRGMALHAHLKLAESSAVPDVDTASDITALRTRLLCSLDESDRLLACTLSEIIKA
jgi:rSAM/selenodomain-associated transferase 1